MQSAILDFSALESGKNYRMVLSGPFEVAHRLERLPENTFTLDFNSVSRSGPHQLVALVFRPFRIRARGLVE